MVLRLRATAWPPDAARRPLYQLGTGIELRCEADDGAGVAVAATGGRCDIRRPDGLVVTRTGVEITSPATGEFRAVAQADQAGTWSYEWVFTGPSEAHVVGYFQVQGSPVLPPGPGQPIVVTDDLNPVDTEDGGRLYAARVSGLPRLATAQAGDLLYGVRGGASHAIELAAVQAAVVEGNAAQWFPSRAAAATAAAGGAIPTSVEVLWTAGYATARDGGAAPYAWVAADPGHAMKFPNGGTRGGWWELDAETLRPEMAGGFGVPLGQWPAVDRSAAFLALAALGRVIRTARDRRYLYAPPTTTHLVLPDGAVLEGPWNTGIALTDPANQTRVDWSRVPGLVLDGVSRIRVDSFAQIRKLNLLHASLAAQVPINTWPKILAYGRDLAGRGWAIETGQIGPSQSIELEDVTFVGFAGAVKAPKANRSVFRRLQGDVVCLVDASDIGAPLLTEDAWNQSIVDGDPTEISSAAFTAGALTNDGAGGTRLTLAGFAPWLASQEDIPRLIGLSGGDEAARNALLLATQVLRPAGAPNAFDLLDAADAPIAWRSAMASVAGTFQVTVELRDHRRPIASVALSPAGNWPRVTLERPFPPLAGVVPILSTTLIAGPSEAAAAPFRRSHRAVARITDQVFDLTGVAWVSGMEAVTGRLDIYPSLRLGDDALGVPSIAIRYIDVAGGRVSRGNIKGTETGLYMSGKTQQAEGFRWEPPRSRGGEGGVVIHGTQAVVMIGEGKLIGGTCKGAEVGVRARNTGENPIEITNFDAGSPATNLVVEDGIVTFVQGKLDRGRVDIQEAAARLIILGASTKGLEFVNTTGATPAKSKLLAWASPEQYRTNKADAVLVGPDAEVTIANVEGTTDVPTAILDRRTLNTDGVSSFLAEGDTIARLLWRGERGPSANVTDFAELLVRAPAIGASWRSELVLRLGVAGALTDLLKVDRDGIWASAPGPFDDDEAAIAAGLTAGQLYRTASGLTWVGAAMRAEVQAVTWAQNSALSSWFYFGAGAPSGLQVPAAMDGVYLELVSAEDLAASGSIPSAPDTNTISPIADFQSANGRYTLGAGKRWAFDPTALRGQGWLAVRSVNGSGVAVVQTAARAGTWHYVVG